MSSVLESLIKIFVRWIYSFQGHNGGPLKGTTCIEYTDMADNFFVDGFSLSL